MIAKLVIQFLVHRDNITVVHNVHNVPRANFVPLEATRKLHVQLVISVQREVSHLLCARLDSTRQQLGRQAVIIVQQATLVMVTRKLFALSVILVRTLLLPQYLVLKDHIKMKLVNLHVSLAPMDFIVLLVLSNVIFALLDISVHLAVKTHVLLASIQRRKDDKLIAIKIVQKAIDVLAGHRVHSHVHQDGTKIVQISHHVNSAQLVSRAHLLD